MRRRFFILPLAICLAVFGLFSQEASSPRIADSVEAARLNNIGVAYMNQQLFDKALNHFEQAAKLDSQLGIANVNRAIALLNLGRIGEAKPLLDGAVKRDPKDPHVWYSLGLLQKNSSDPQAAVDAFRHVIEIDSSDADTWYFLGSAYSQLRQFPDAIDAFDHALKINPLHASAQFGLSRAYQQSGDTAHAREHLARFQYVTQNKLGAAISLAYGEQGKYSLAEESPSAVEKVPPTISVKFVDVTKEAGIVSRALPAVIDPTKQFFEQGSGACFLDYDNDGKIDIFLADNGAQGGMSLYHNLGNGKFEDVTKQAGVDPTAHATSCTGGDYDNDGFADLAVSLGTGIMLFHNEKNGTFKDVAAAAGIKNTVSIDGLTFIDYDHDGDLDLYGSSGLVMIVGSVKSGTSVMWRNNGNGTFTNVTGDTDLSIFSSASNAVGTDFNNDRAVDLVVADWTGGTIFQNPREGKFQILHPFSPQRNSGDKAVGPKDNSIPTVGVAVLDFDHDGWMDIALTRLTDPGLTLWHNNRGKSFDQVQLPSTGWVKAYGVAAIDYDNDGWVDLVAVGETAQGKGEVKLFRNLGPDGFKDVTADVGLDKIQLKDPRAIITGDFDGDGATDLLITQNHGPTVLLRNEGGNKNNWLRLALTGLNDNKSAIGTKIEVFSGGNRQKFEIAGSSGYLGQNSTQITVGLGQSKQADVVRMLWPTGVLQDEVEVPANREQAYTEIDRRGSSCPTLFAWDGEHYQLVADILGAGVVGHWVGPGQRNIPRPAEYVKVDGRAIHEKNGKLSFRLMEPMEEVVYLDRVRLVAVDHPSGVEVYPNEYFASNPPYPAFKIVTSRDARPPAGAWDEHGHNVLPDLLAHRYFGDYGLLPFKGFAKPHSLELDLGEKYEGGPLRLLMHGEIEYFTATGMYAADQAGIHAIAPYVEAQDANGKWKRVLEDMGFPAGLPRTITADLSTVLPKGTRRIRLSTNLQIYWDNILIDRTPQNVRPTLTPVPLERANLEFHGYPRQIEAQPPGNVQYVYEQVSRTGPYARQAGTYTRYGDVRPLLTGFDDRLVVLGSGEEVALEFNPDSLPALPKGWTRDYFFEANGYEKDMDFYAAEGSTVEPLPFRRMSGYPYRGQTFPADDSHLNYLLNYNTRYVSGNEPAGYSYDYGQPK
jgi:tetratricopeptide (TPR) repeat protein